MSSKSADDLTTVDDECFLRTSIPCLHTKALSAHHAVDTCKCCGIDTATAAHTPVWSVVDAGLSAPSDFFAAPLTDTACHLIVNMHALHSIKVQIDEKSGQLKITPTEATSYHVSSKIFQAAQELNNTRNDYSNYFVKIRSLVSSRSHVMRIQLNYK